MERQRRRKASSGNAPALDTVKISSSAAQLTSGMSRGPSLLVARLRFPPETPFSIGDLSFILSLFSTFVPEYNLTRTQCYFFCNVVWTICKGCHNAKMEKDEGFGRAGKLAFGKLRVPIPICKSKRNLFISTYSIIRICEQNRHPTGALTQENIDMLLKMVTVSFEDASIRAVNALTWLTLHSAEGYQLVPKAGTVTKLIGAISSASPRLNTYLLAAFHAIFQVGQPFDCDLEPADHNRLMCFLLQYLSSNTANCKTASSIMCRFASFGGGKAVATLCSSLSMELPSSSQLVVLEAISTALDHLPNARLLLGRGQRPVIFRVSIY